MRDLKPYLVEFDNTQVSRFWAEDEDHAKEQAWDAEPDLTIERVGIETNEYDEPYDQLRAQSDAERILLIAFAVGIVVFIWLCITYTGTL